MSDICAGGLPGRAFRHAGALPFRFPCDPDAGSRRRGPAPSPSPRLSFCRPFLFLRILRILFFHFRTRTTTAEAFSSSSSAVCFAENTSLCLPSSQRSSLPSQLLLCGCAGHIVDCRNSWRSGVLPGRKFDLMRNPKSRAATALLSFLAAAALSAQQAPIRAEAEPTVMADAASLMLPTTQQPLASRRLPCTSTMRPSERQRDAFPVTRRRRRTFLRESPQKPSCRTLSIQMMRSHSGFSL